MTTEDLARAALPYARRAVRRARPSVVEAVGRGGWLALWPAWAVVTGPLLPVLVRLGVELGVGLSAPYLAPILRVLNGLSGYLSDAALSAPQRALLAGLTGLLNTPRGDLSEPVRFALDAAPAADADAGAEVGGGRGDL